MLLLESCDGCYFRYLYTDINIASARLVKSKNKQVLMAPAKQGLQTNEEYFMKGFDT
jgi:hypothetical protein